MAKRTDPYFETEKSPETRGYSPRADTVAKAQQAAASFFLQELLTFVTDKARWDGTVPGLIVEIQHQMLRNVVEATAAAVAADFTDVVRRLDERNAEIQRNLLAKIEVLRARLDRFEDEEDEEDKNDREGMWGRPPELAGEDAVDYGALSPAELAVLK